MKRQNSPLLKNIVVKDNCFYERNFDNKKDEIPNKFQSRLVSPVGIFKEF
jgi:hypothetical protein